MATFFASHALAAVATTNLGVTASVADNCIISTADVAFGAYDPIGANAGIADLLGSGTVTVTCTTGASVVVTLGLGANDNGGTAADPSRRLKNGTTNFLNYTLWSNAGRSTEWGNTGPTGKADTGTGSASALTVWGTIPAAQNVPTGPYSDTVLATVTF